MKIIDARNSSQAVIDFLRSRKESHAEIASQVKDIGHAIRTRGWEAVCEYCARFDQVEKEPRADEFRVTADDLKSSFQQIKPELADAIRTSIDRVRNFHQRQKRQDWFLDEAGIRTGQLIRPLSRVGIYAPAGTAPLFSTLIMDAVPAQVAGCPEIMVCSAPQKVTGKPHPTILATCYLLGLDPSQIWGIGGAQAIFSMAYGLKGLPSVDGIYGPGNQYVMEAKRQVLGEVKIESLPGNSEILVIADDTAEPHFVAADLLSQAEHAGGEMSILVTTSPELLEKVQQVTHEMLQDMERKEIAKNSLSSGGLLVWVKDLNQASEIANLVAPEHLEIQTRNPDELLPAIRHAGAVFLGPWSSEPIGDYTAGTNHVLPTGGTARFSSALSVDDFIKKISLVKIDKSGLRKIGPAAMTMAEAEGLMGHKAAIQIRLES